MTRARTLLVPAYLMACGPAVAVEPPAEGADGTTTAVTPASEGTANGPPPSCTPGDARTCECPGGAVGTRPCLSDGAFGACTCSGTDTSTGSESTGGNGDSSGAADSSTGAPQPVECPEIPVPCSGWVTVASNAGLTDASMCTSIDGSLWLVDSISDISSLGCITSIGVLRIEATALTDLSGLARLEHLDTLEIVGAPALTQIGLPALTSLERLTVTTNPALEQLDLPALTELTWNVEVTENPGLSNCEVEALLEQVGGVGGDVCYQANARDTCLPNCP